MRRGCAASLSRTCFGLYSPLPQHGHRWVCRLGCVGTFKPKRIPCPEGIFFLFPVQPTLARWLYVGIVTPGGQCQPVVVLWRCRRFQPVLVPEPSVDETYEILLGLRERYEAHHKLRYTDDALMAAAKYSSQYISDRFLPDKVRCPLFVE